MSTRDTCTTHLDFSGTGMLLHFCLKPDFWKPLSCSIARLIVLWKRTLFSFSFRDPVISCGVCVFYFLFVFRLCWAPVTQPGLCEAVIVAHNLDWTKMNCVVGKQHLVRWLIFLLYTTGSSKKADTFNYLYIYRERERDGEAGECVRFLFIFLFIFFPLTHFRIVCINHVPVK